MITLAKNPATGAHSGTYEGRKSFTSNVSSQPIKQPDQTAKPGQRRGLDQKLKQNIALFCSDSFADADLACPFGHGYEHDIHHADTADHQADRRDDDHRQMHAAR